jgi:dihydrolipoamide dehydrogenase
MAESFDVVLIGSGPGGYVGAIRAAQIGLRAAVVERNKLGGTCLHVGCIPTKALLHVAELLEGIHRSEDFGIRVGAASLDLAAVHRYKDRVIATLHRGVEYLMRKNKVTVFHGTGRLAGRGKVRIALPDGGETECEAKNIVVATGSRPRSIPGVAIDGIRILSSDDVIGLKEIPRRLAILGAGAVGVEFASVFTAFGSEVTLIEILPHALPTEDEEISETVEKALTRRGIKIRTGSKLTKVDPVEGGLRLTVEKDGQQDAVEAEYLLVAVGRAALSEGVGLESVGVQVERGFIVTDDHNQTNVKGIWAIGDVVGGYMLAHKASQEAILAVETMAGQEVRPINYDAVPRCTYSIPEVASFGLSEAQAKERGHKVRVGRFPFVANSKAAILGVREGLIKVVTDDRYGETLGMHMVGPRVTELLTEGILGKTAEATITEIAHAPHAHPTLTEAVHEAALDALGRVIHL